MKKSKDCYCDEDQGAGYTFKDEHGECDVCAQRENYQKYEVITKTYPTDASYIVIAPFGTKYEFLIEGVGWRIMEHMHRKQSAFSCGGWSNAIIQEQIEHLIGITKVCPNLMDCKIEYATKL